MNRIAHICLICFFTAIVILFAGPVSAQTDAYDPLTVSGQRSPERLDLVVNDTGRQRAIPVLVYLPPQKSSAPVVLFSHGLGGSCEGNAYLGQHWAARGYMAVFVQHPGSDTSVWQGKPLSERMTAMKHAASLWNLLLRIKDIPAVLDQLERWNAADGHALARRLDLKRVGMSGHSFGAATTQAVSGQRTARGKSTFTDPRIIAAIMFSPNSPRRGSAKQAFSKVRIPWMLMTGTKDIGLISGAGLESRLAVFPALPPGGKYELVLYRAEHSAFTERSLPGDTEKRNPNHHRAILALSTAFWDTWLRRDAAAKAWLDGGDPRSVLEKDDRWQTK